MVLCTEEEKIHAEFKEFDWCSFTCGDRKFYKNILYLCFSVGLLPTLRCFLSLKDRGLLGMWYCCPWDFFYSIFSLSSEHGS